MKNLIRILTIASLYTSLIPATIEPRKLFIDKGRGVQQTPVDSIVNAANQGLKNGGGVCGAIFETAGVQKLEAEIQKKYGPNPSCPTGESRITGSHGLEKRKINYIIHAVGPDCTVIKDTAEQNKLLRSAYTSALKLADQNNVKSIAFPFISSAIYAFPKDRAAKIALEAVEAFFKDHPESSVRAIHFSLFDKNDTPFFEDAIKQNKTLSQTLHPQLVDFTKNYTKPVVTELTRQAEQELKEEQKQDIIQPTKPANHRTSKKALSIKEKRNSVIEDSNTSVTAETNTPEKKQAKKNSISQPSAIRKSFEKLQDHYNKKNSVIKSVLLRICAPFHAAIYRKSTRNF